MALAIANRYASALADVVSQPDSDPAPRSALDQLRSFQELLDESADLRGVLISPAVRPSEKRALIATLCARLGCAEKIRNFIYVVVDNRRAPLFREFVDAFRAWLDSHSGLARIEVRVASPIDADQRAELEERFQTITGNRIEASYVVDPHVLGGSVVRVGSKVYDGSLRSKLQSLDRAMTGAR